MSYTSALESETEVESQADRRQQNEPAISRTTARVLGVLMLIAGAFAIVFPLIASVAYTFFFGALLIVGGSVQAYSGAKRMRRRRGWLEFAIGLIGIIGGVLIFISPMAGLLSLTLLLGAFFFADGVLRLVLANRADHRTWTIAGGLLSLALGLLIAFGLPATAFYALGLLWGVHALFVGAAYLAGRVPSVGTTPAPGL